MSNHNKSLNGIIIFTTNGDWFMDSVNVILRPQFYQQN